MAIKKTDWCQYLSSDSELPPDVIFKIEGGGEVSAHRLLLAGGSRVFRALFFGPMKEKKEEVVIKDTTVEAFTIMINFIYQTPNFSLKEITCPETLFEVYNVSKRYQLDELNDMVKEAFQNFHISEDNVEHAALTAKNYAVFEDMSKILIDKCHNTMKNLPITLESIVNVATAAKRPRYEAVSEHLMQRCNGFLRENLRTADDVFDFILKTKENPKADLGLLSGILKSKPLATWCTLNSYASELPMERQNPPLNPGYPSSSWARASLDSWGSYNLLMSLAKLSKQWRITHSFKPTSYRIYRSYGLCIRGLQYELGFSYTNTEMEVNFKGPIYFNLPAIGVWTTIQASHEVNEAGKPIFSIVVGGVEVHKEEIPFQTGYTDVKVYASNPASYHVQEGCIMNIIVESKE